MRLLIVVLSAMALAFPLAATATAEEESPQVAVATTTTAAPGDTAPSGPELKPDTEADKAESRRKLVMGITSVVLVGIVIWGRSVRRKRKKVESSK